MSKKLLNVLLVVMMLAVLVPTAMAAPPVQEGGQDYVVVADDWLSKLADKYLGNPMAYSAIVTYTNQKNAEDASYAKITNPDLIEVGWKIYIPSAEEVAAAEVAFAVPGKRGGTLHLFTSQTIGRIDPITTQANYLQVLARQLYGQLVLYKTGTWEVIPDLAKSWDVSEDGLTYTFTMRPDLKFHDGSPIQLSDVVFSLERARSEVSVWQDSYANVDSIEADSNKNAVVLRLSASDPFLLEKLAAIGGSAIVPQAAVEKYGDEFATKVENTIASGPYRLIEKSETEQMWERFGDFPEPGYVEKISWRTIPDRKTQRLEFEAGSVDAILSVLEAEDAERFRTDPQFDRHYKEFVAPDRTWYGFNPTMKPFDDIRVRQAIAMSIDMDKVVQVWGMARSAHTLIHPDLPGYNPSLVVYSKDLDKAKALLEEAGYSDGLDVELYIWNISRFVPMGEVVQQQLAEADIRVDLRVIEFGTFMSEVRKGSYPFFINLANIGVPDSAQLLYNSFHSEGPFTTGYQNDGVDRLLEEAIEERDLARRAQLAAEAEKLILKDAMAIPIMDRYAATVFQPWVHGIEDITPIYPHHRYNEVWLDPEHR